MQEAPSPEEIENIIAEMNKEFDQEKTQLKQNPEMRGALKEQIQKTGVTERASSHKSGESKVPTVDDSSAKLLHNS